MTYIDAYIRDRLERKFTRKIVRTMLSELTDGFLNKKFDDVAQIGVWFTVFNIPVKFNERTMKFQVVDHSFKQRFIPEEDESVFDELNELQNTVYHYPSYATRSLEGLPRDHEIRVKMTKIISYLESKEYNLVLTESEYVLKNVSE